jgi:uncharacterized protein
MRELHLLGSRGQILRALAPESRRERMRGLLGHPSLGKNEVMLLCRTRSIHTFGMRLPIRAVFLDGTFVVRSLRLLPPGRLVLPRPGIRHVLECAERTDLRLGDRLRIIESP